MRRALLGLGWALTAAAAAQPYPSKPVRWILPAQAGGANDTAARLIAPRLSEALGQPVIVDNRGGAGGNLAMETIARAQPDGYSLAQVSTIQAMNMSFYRQVRFDLTRDVAPVGELLASTTVLVVHPSLPARTAQELIAYARAHPGRLNFVSGTNGATGYYLKHLAGIDMEIVVYKGTPPAVTDMIAGQGHAMVTTAASVMQFVRQGKLRALAVTSSTRGSALYPELPPLADAVPGFENPMWYGLVAPAHTPAAVLRRLHGELGRLLQSAELQQRLAAIGFEVSTGSPQQFGRRIATEVRKWPPVVEMMGGPTH